MPLPITRQAERTHRQKERTEQGDDTCSVLKFFVEIKRDLSYYYKKQLKKLVVYANIYSLVWNSS